MSSDVDVDVDGDEARGELSLTSDGLELPDDLGSFDDGIVVRTPFSTIQYRDPGWENRERFPLLAPRQFDVDDDHAPDPANPDLSPDLVSIKPYGGDAETYRVDVEQPDDQEPEGSA